VKGLYPTRRLETMDQLAALVGEIELYGLGAMKWTDTSRGSTPLRSTG